jgi:predicted ribosome quality control (RQC) complex YloA/Tae2 family protein
LFLTTGDNNIDIGNSGIPDEANTIRVGTQGTQKKTFIAGVSGAGVSGMAVKVNAAGQLGTAPSSARFKEAIKPIDKASETILALKPVSFRYKKEIDPERTPQFGLVAEEVDKVNPDLVARDAQGKPYTVRYDAVNAMLLNEFLKEHSTVQELKKEVAALTATVKQQASQIQKVSAQLEMQKPSAETVVNNQ